MLEMRDERKRIARMMSEQAYKERSTMRYERRDNILDSRSNMYGVRDKTIDTPRQRSEERSAKRAAVGDEKDVKRHWRS